LIDIMTLLKDLWRTKNLQEWINNRYKKEGYFPLPYCHFNSIETKNKVLFPIDDQFHSIIEVIEDYMFDDILPDDIVIDIGANIGGFALQAAKISSYVYAIEPIMIKQLRYNAGLNNEDIHIIEGALGISGGFQEFNYGQYSRKARTFTFSELKEIAGGCDFLKCDCEGGEWSICPDELSGVRRIEMELHRIGSNHQKMFKELMNYLDLHYRYSYKDLSINPLLYGIVHAEKRS
jgi:FkbM family methyltransferase